VFDLFILVLKLFSFSALAYALQHITRKLFLVDFRTEDA